MTLTPIIKSSSIQHLLCGFFSSCTSSSKSMFTVARPCCYFCWSWLATWADQTERLFRMIHRSWLVSWWFINFGKVVGTKDWSCLLIFSTLGFFLILRERAAHGKLYGKNKAKKDENGAERLIVGGNPPGTIQVQVFFEDINFAVCLEIIIWSKFIGGVFQLRLCLHNRKWSENGSGSERLISCLNVFEVRRHFNENEEARKLLEQVG